MRCRKQDCGIDEQSLVYMHAGELASIMHGIFECFDIGGVLKYENPEYTFERRRKIWFSLSMKTLGENEKDIHKLRLLNNRIIEASRTRNALIHGNPTFRDGRVVCLLSGVDLKPYKQLVRSHLKNNIPIGKRSPEAYKRLNFIVENYVNWKSAEFSYKINALELTVQQARWCKIELMDLTSKVLQIHFPKMSMKHVGPDSMFSQHIYKDRNN